MLTVPTPQLLTLAPGASGIASLFSLVPEAIYPLLRPRVKTSYSIIFSQSYLNPLKNNEHTQGRNLTIDYLP